MDDYEEITQTVEVPRNVGVDGFLRALREVLRLDNIQQVVIDARGQVSYKRYVPIGAPPRAVAVEYEGLEPSSIIRHGSILEVSDTASPALTIARMYDQVAVERLTPVCWAVGADTTLHTWFGSTGFIPAVKERFYGLPVQRDRAIPDTVIVLCAAFTRNATLIDCHRFIKIDTGTVTFPLTTVDVL